MKGFCAFAEKGHFLLKTHKKKRTNLGDWFPFWRRHPDLNRGIKVLQTSALPLGYGAI